MSANSPKITHASRLAGAVWGHLVGDATGVPYEFGPARPAHTVEFGAAGTHRQKTGTWSDDGALMLALLDSLLAKGFDPDDQGRRALAWERDGAYTPDGDGLFDEGGTTARSLRRLRDGIPAVDAGVADEHACGNGSLMRILPLALVDRDIPADELVGRAHLASRVTHGHARCQVACAVYCLVVRALVANEAPEVALSSSLALVRQLYSADPSLEAHLAALDELEAWSDRSGRGLVLDSFWSAWDAFAGATGYDDAIRRAVAYGRDTDTTAAIAGGLAGAHWGWQAIPVAWRRGMRGHDVAQPLVDRLVEKTTGARTSTLHPLRVDPVPLGGVPELSSATGRVGITFLLGKKRDGYTGPHWRDLDLDLARLRELGVDALLLMVEDWELRSSLVSELPGVMAGGTPELIWFPIRDVHVPDDPIAFRGVIRGLVDRIAAGEAIAIACRGGIDRSGMAASCLLVEAGLDAEAAMNLVHASRRYSITQPREREFVRAWPPTP